MARFSDCTLHLYQSYKAKPCGLLSAQTAFNATGDLPTKNQCITPLLPASKVMSGGPPAASLGAESRTWTRRCEAESIDPCPIGKSVESTIPQGVLHPISWFNGSCSSCSGNTTHDQLSCAMCCESGFIMEWRRRDCCRPLEHGDLELLDSV